ncbi:MAG: methyl-accepting chemotaxis protein [Bryobacteraceae bacterium]|nr:methyl-accepting chemotaxis protein [Bryobacteraceae bacterium]
MQNTQRRPLGFQLLAAVGGMMFLLMLGGAISLYLVEDVSGKLDAAANVTARKIQIVGELKTHTTAMRNGSRGVLLYSLLKQPERTATAERSFREAARGVSERVEEIRPLLLTARGREDAATIADAVRTWVSSFELMAQAAKGGDFEGEVKRQLDEAFKQAGRMDEATASMDATLQKFLEEARAEAARAQRMGRWVIGLFLTSSLLTGWGVFVVVHGASTRLRRIAQIVGEGADQMLSASSQVADSSRSVAQGATEQAASIEETSASTEEINSMARRNEEIAGQGLAQVNRMSQEISRTTGALELMSGAMSEINASSDKIARIIRVIEDIAFQTNILALNAAVEAARAGEAGMGFAVVADEVRNLAQRSSQAARDTTQLIEESIEKARQGRVRVQEVSAAAQAISEGAAQVKVVVEEVSTGSAEQSRGLAQIARAVADMQGVIQRTAANSEESAAASEELTAQAQSLQAAASELRAMVSGDAERRAA